MAVILPSFPPSGSPSFSPSTRPVYRGGAAPGGGGGGWAPDDLGLGDTLRADWWRLGDSTIAVNSDGSGGTPAFEDLCGYWGSLRTGAGVASEYGRTPIIQGSAKATYKSDGTYASGALQFPASAGRYMLANYSTTKPLTAGFTAGMLVRTSAANTSGTIMMVPGEDIDPVFTADLINPKTIRYGQAAGVYDNYDVSGLASPNPFAAWHSVIIRMEPGSPKTWYLYIDGVQVDSFTTASATVDSTRFLIYNTSNADYYFRAGFAALQDIGAATVPDLHSWLAGGA